MGKIGSMLQAFPTDGSGGGEDAFVANITAEIRNMMKSKGIGGGARSPEGIPFSSPMGRNPSGYMGNPGSEQVTPGVASITPVSSPSLSPTPSHPYYQENQNPTRQSSQSRNQYDAESTSRSPSKEADPLSFADSYLSSTRPQARDKSLRYEGGSSSSGPLSGDVVPSVQVRSRGPLKDGDVPLLKLGRDPSQGRPAQPVAGRKVRDPDMYPKPDPKPDPNPNPNPDPTFSANSIPHGAPPQYLIFILVP